MLILWFFFWVFIYMIIYSISVFLMLKFQKELDIPDYDNYDDYDDWASVEDAITCYSFFWFIAWPILLILKFINLFSFITNYINEKITKS